MTEITERHAPAFLLASPGIRVANGSIQVPGDAAALPGWQALVGRQVTEPIDFVRALLAGSEGRLAYFYGAAAQLAPAERHVLLSLDTGDVAIRTAAARRMLAVFERVATGWDITGAAVLAVPASIPLCSSPICTIDAGGVPRVPGTAAFWTLVFGDSTRSIANAADSPGGPPADFTLALRTDLHRRPGGVRTPYQQVLFASRRARPLTR